MRQCVLLVFTLYFTATEEAIAGCVAPLGLQSRSIQDAQLSASTYMSDYQLPSAARLHNTININSFGAWCAADIDTHQWFQIDLLTTTNLSAVASQGIQVSEGDYWVTSYSLNYSCDGMKWFRYTVQGVEAVFQGNNDSSSVVTNKLPYPVVARFIRIRPLAWNVLGSICLRLELYGCQTSQACPHPTINTSKVITTKSTVYSTSKRKTAFSFTRKLPTHSNSSSEPKRTPQVAGVVPTNRTPTDCSHALGMQSGAIRNSQIHASSFKSLWTRPSEGRLHNQRSAHRRSLGGWCAEDGDNNPYLQVDLVNMTMVTAIGTQGLPGNGNWAAKYRLSYSCDGNVWFEYQQGKVFEGNSDSRQVKVNKLPIPIETRLVRLWPRQSGPHRKACVRLEIYGCAKSGIVCVPRKNDKSFKTGAGSPDGISTHSSAIRTTDQATLGSEDATEAREKNMIVIVRAHGQVNTQSASAGFLPTGNIYLLLTCFLLLLDQL